MYNHAWDRKLLGRLAVLVVVYATTYAALYFAIGEPFGIPNGECFAVILLWTAAHVGGWLAVQCRVPSLLGMLAAGLVLQNIPGDPLRAYPHSWATKIKAAGLATIMMRAGLKIDYSKAFRQRPLFTLALGVVPVVSEAFLNSSVFATLYGMPYLLSAAGGFLLAAISPTVMVTGMLDLQKRGYGDRQGVPSLLMAASGVDVVVGVAGYSIFISLAIPDPSLPPGWSVARGPVAVLLGAVAALLGGAAMAPTRLWRYPTRAALGMFGLVQMFMMLFVDQDLGPGGGALAAIGLAAVAALLWTAGRPKRASVGPRPYFRSDVDALYAVLWLLIVQPLLFGTIGSSIDFDDISGSTVPKALLVTAIGIGTRVLLAGLLAALARFSLKEIVFIALVWIPKATVQGALSSAPLDLVESTMHGDVDYKAYVEWGNQLLATAVISIVVTAPLGLLAIEALGPWLLDKKPAEAGQELGVMDAAVVAVTRKRRSSTVLEGHMCVDSPDMLRLNAVDKATQTTLLGADGGSCRNGGAGGSVAATAGNGAGDGAVWSSSRGCSRGSSCQSVDAEAPLEKEAVVVVVQQVGPASAAASSVERRRTGGAASESADGA